MFKFLRNGAVMLLMACIGAGVVGCSDDDPNYENVQPPVVPVAHNTLSGVVTDWDGNPLAGAKVSLDADQASTDAQGIYLFEDVKAGTYTIKVEAAGKLTKEEVITVAQMDKTQNLVWNVSLPADVKVEVTASQTEETQASVETEALEGNEKAEVMVETTVPAGAVDTDEEVKVVVTPIYNATDVQVKAAARADEETLMCGATLSCSKEGVSLTKAIELGFNVDAELAGLVEAKMLKNGQWQSVSYRVDGGKVIVDAQEFASYGLFLGVSFSVKESQEAVAFEQNEWDNLYGAKDMVVDAAKFSYKSGTEITTKATSVLTALLVEKVAQRFGATVSTLAGSYPLGVTLPVGTAMKISGTQSKLSVTATADGKSVSATSYGTVTVVVTTYNRQHSGGSNN